MTDQLALDVDQLDGSWYDVGMRDSEGNALPGTILVVADSPQHARERAIVELRDIGVLPGPMRDSWRRLCEATR